MGRGHPRPGRAIVGVGGRVVPDRAALALSAAPRRDGAHPSTVSPAHASLVGFAPSLTAGAGDTVRAAPRAPEPLSDARMAERSRPAGEDIILDYV